MAISSSGHLLFENNFSKQYDLFTDAQKAMLYNQKGSYRIVSWCGKPYHVQIAITRKLSD
jgi:hypothetical protein